MTTHPQVWQVQETCDGVITIDLLHSTRGKAIDCAVELVRLFLMDDTAPVPFKPTFKPTGIDDEFVFQDEDYEVTVWGRQVD